jgi:HSP20 family molecular chaperone IbpA
MEIEYGAFRRTVELGVDIDPTSVTATYDKGMLKVVLPLAPNEPEDAVSIEVTQG